MINDIVVSVTDLENLVIIAAVEMKRFEAPYRDVARVLWVLSLKRYILVAGK